MSVIITLEAKLKPNQKEKLLSMLEELLPETRAYKGFIDITIHIEKESNHLLFFEKWETVNDYESYLAWRMETGVMKRLGMLFEEQPVIRYYDTYVV